MSRNILPAREAASTDQKHAAAVPDLGKIDERSTLRSFTHTAPDIATRMWHTGVDPMTGKPVKIVPNFRDRKL